LPTAPARRWNGPAIAAGIDAGIDAERRARPGGGAA